MLNIFKIFILFLLISLNNSCGIYSFSGASIPPEASTVSVDYFPNNARIFNATISQQITEMLQDKLMSQTSLSLIEVNGDLSFKGEITDYRVSPGSLVANETAAYNKLTITVKVEFINEYDESKNFQQTFSKFAEFPSTQNLSEAEPEKIPEILELIVEEIFNKAVVNW